MAALAGAGGAVVAEEPRFFVKVGDMESYELATCLHRGMFKPQILEALAGSRAFGGFLSGVSRLLDCAVYVNAVEPEPGVRGTCALAGAITLSTPAPGAANCYLRIQLPAATGAGGLAAAGAAASSDGSSSASQAAAVTSAGAGGAAPLTWTGGDLTMTIDRRGLMNQLAIAVARGATFAILDEEGTAVCCGFFFAADYGMSVYHDAQPNKGDTLRGISFISPSEHESHEFEVVDTNKDLDFIILRRTSERVRPIFFGLAPTDWRLEAASIFRVGAGISAARCAGEEGELVADFSMHQTSVKIVGPTYRHFAYTDESAPGDSGGAVVLVGGRVVGMHLAGWNHAPDTVGDAEDGDEELIGAAVTTAVVGARRRRDAERALAAHAPDDTSSVARSYKYIVGSITTGGWALCLLSTEVRAALSAYLPVS